MSDIEPNFEIHLHPAEIPVQGLVRFVDDEYPDNYDNRWSIELLGTKESVMSIVDEPRILLAAVPEGHDDYPKRLEDAKAWMEAHPDDFSSLEPPTDADLWATITLEVLAQPDKMHIVDIVIDPIIFDRMHLWTFYLRRPTSNFRIGITEDHGSVGRRAWSTGKEGIGHAEVWRLVDGNPTKYTITTHPGVCILAGSELEGIVRKCPE